MHGHTCRPRGWARPRSRSPGRVRRGDTSATQVVADHLEHDRARRPGARRVPRGARRRGDRRGGEGRRAGGPGQPAAGRGAGRGQGEHRRSPACPPGTGRRPPARPVAEADHEVVRRLRGAGAVVARRDPDAGARPLGDHRRRDRGDPQPVGHRPHPRRLLRRRGRRRRRRAGADRARQRRARLDPHPGGLLRPGRAQARPGRGARASSARTTGSAWPSTACSPPRSPTRRSASRCWPAVARRSWSPAAAAAGRRLAALAGARGARPDAPNRDAVAAAGRLLRDAGHDTVTGRPGLPDGAGPAGHGHLVRRGVPRTSGPPGWTGAAAAAHPPARRRSASGRSGAGTSGRPTGPPGASARSASSPTTRSTCCSPRRWRPRRRRPTGWSGRSWRANMLANIRYAPYAAPWNIAGLPALVVPVGRAPGRPAGRRAAGRPARQRAAAARRRRASSRCRPLAAARARLSPRPRRRLRAWRRASAHGAGWHDRGMTDLVGSRRRRAARELLAGVVRTTPLEPSPAADAPRWAGRPGSSARTCSAPARTRCAARTCGSPGCRRRSGPAAWWRRAPATTPRAWRWPPACSARTPPSSCRWARRCRRWPPPRGTAPQIELVGNTVDEALVAAQEFAERDRRDADPPVRPPGRDRRPGHGGAGDPRAVPGRGHDHHRRSAAAG